MLRQDIGSAGELRQMVNSGGIRMTGTPISSAPAPQSVTIAGLTIPAPPSDVPAATDGSVDAVYIVATQSQLTLIKPMIDMATSSRGKPAMYASSRSYQAGAGPDFRTEMEGLQFSDIPLLAGSNPQLLQQASARFRNDYSLVRLYAMGMDAGHWPTTLLKCASCRASGFRHHRYAERVAELRDQPQTALAAIPSGSVVPVS